MFKVTYSEDFKNTIQNEIKSLEDQKTRINDAINDLQLFIDGHESAQENMNGRMKRLDTKHKKSSFTRINSMDGLQLTPDQLREKKREYQRKWKAKKAEELKAIQNGGGATYTGV